MPLNSTDYHMKTTIRIQKYIQIQVKLKFSYIYIQLIDEDDSINQWIFKDYKLSIFVVCEIHLRARCIMGSDTGSLNRTLKFRLLPRQQLFFTLPFNIVCLFVLF